ncbi:RNA-binding domain-containing protein [Kineococcus arenarius]|uniref:RNA-binding domain-containing protein n=1 Tax=unclassified Kineococcus TaxID=2621656 RepID=UPI003D7E8C24
MLSTIDELRAVIAAGETLEVEFKSDRRRLSDGELVEAVACMANGRGGHLLLGVEDGGGITGAQARHGARTDPRRIEAVIANRTVPPLSSEVDVVEIDGVDIVVVAVGAASTPVGTASGVYTRRALKADGTPECVPYAFHEMFARRAHVGEADYAALEVPGVSWNDLDPLEFERFRELVNRSGGRGDRGLGTLADDELLRALGLGSVRGPSAAPEPLMGAVLLFGRQETLRRRVPTHEALFQVLRGTAVEANAALGGPLLSVAEELFQRVEARNFEEEVDAGLVRLAIPLISEVAVREAIANALVHRDYTKLGPITVQFTDESVTISNPGGFPEGVRLDNYLTESRPRSRLLADAFKRAGVVERTGRGINRMVESSLRIGREGPDFSRSSDTGVTAAFVLGEADTALARYVLERERNTGRPMRLGELQILHHLRGGGRLDVAEAARLVQRTESETRTVLVRMVEGGLVEQRGSGRGQRFHLSSSAYRALDAPSAYVRVRGFDSIQHREMVATYVGAHGRITRSEVAELCALSPAEASVLLRSMVAAGRLELHGTRRWAYYTLVTP